jgi:hypothetical protein
MFFVLPIFLKNIYYLRQNFYKIKNLARHTKLSHKHITSLFIILHNHYLLKISKFKNQVSKLKFKI